MVNKTMISAQELARILGLSVDTIWRYTREKRIPFLEIGPRQYRYIERDVFAALHSKGSFSIKEEQAPYDVKTMTHENFAKLPANSGDKLQLIDGHLVREPSPTLQHQRVSSRLLFILTAYFSAIDPQGEILPAPLDLFLNENSVVQPDILYLPSGRLTENTPVDSLPELLVEVLSSASARNDRVKKLHLYQQAKIPHYWIVDPNSELIECYELKDNHYISIRRFGDGKFEHPSFPNLSFELNSLFKKP